MRVAAGLAVGATVVVGMGAAESIAPTCPPSRPLSIRICPPALTPTPMAGGVALAIGAPANRRASPRQAPSRRLRPLEPHSHATP
jgi:hypothetical protein